MVPTFTCGLLRSNFSFAISVLLRPCGAGALARVCRPYRDLLFSSPTQGLRPGLNYSAPPGLGRSRLLFVRRWPRPRANDQRLFFSSTYITSETWLSALVRSLQSSTNKTLAAALDRKLSTPRKAVAPCFLTSPGSRRLSLTTLCSEPI